MPLIQARSVSKVFVNGTQALEDISFTIGRNEFVSFLGPSGCGKSTILRLIAGLETPSSGRLSASAHGRRQNDGLAFVFQDATLLPWLDVAKNVALPLTFDSTRRSDLREAVADALELVGLSAHARDLPAQLSGGMRMRVSIARALVSKPRVLLMDEPFAALDEMTRQGLQDELLTIFQRDSGTSVLFVTHNVFEAAYLSSRVIVLGARPGRIVADLEGHSADLRRGPQFRSDPRFSELVTDVSSALASTVVTT